MNPAVPHPRRRRPGPPPGPGRHPRLPALLAAGLVLVGSLLAPPAPAAAPAPTPDRTVPRRILTSFLPVHSLTVGVAGDRARVENWLPTGVDPHDFQFSPRDLRRLADADLLIVAGLGLEGWKEERLRESAGNPRLRVIEAAAGLPPDALIEDPCGHDHGPESAAGGAAGPHHPPNPHFWLDPILAAHAVTNIARALEALDPAGASIYRANAALQVARLHALDREFAGALAGHRDIAFFTVHNAFPYLARRYHLRLAGVVQTTGNEEPSARELADLARTARDQGVRVLFNDGSPSRLTRRLAADLKIPVAALETLEIGDLRPEAYEAGMRRNLRALESALGKGR